MISFWIVHLFSLSYMLIYFKKKWIDIHITWIIWTLKTFPCSCVPFVLTDHSCSLNTTCFDSAFGYSVQLMTYMIFIQIWLVIQGTDFSFANRLFLVLWLMVLFWLILSCRDIYKRICVAGNDNKIVESPTEPKWSSTGIIFIICLMTFI